jgi:PIN domain nuclease of toxin-antitoxin system
MDVLLDTHALLWWLTDAPPLTKVARNVMEDATNDIYVSAASAWEISTKVRLGKLPSGADLASDFLGYLDREGFRALPISTSHAVRAGLLPGDHKDPFDRMLIAQAQAENMPLISNELLFGQYGIRRIW